jgi:hypothetical protein
MQRLLQLGFVPVGHWYLENEILRFNLDRHQNATNILYSFISNGEIKYIGKTTMTLQTRMYGYQNPGPTQITNIRVKNLILNLLQEQNSVDIFVFVDNGLLSYGSYRVNLAAGLEDTLIREIGPEWNFRGNRRVREDIDSRRVRLIQVPAEQQEQVHPVLQVTIGNAYLNQGFFNVGVAYTDLFAGDNAVIEIQLGNDTDNVINGYINRRANQPTDSPRIMGGRLLKRWIQDTFNLNDTMNVEVISPVSIKLS